MVDWIKDKLDSFSSKMFPLKEKCLNVLYNMIAWTYIDSRNVTNIQDPNLKKIYLKHHLGIRVAELPRDVDIGWIKAIDRKEALKTYRRFALLLFHLSFPPPRDCEKKDLQPND